LLNIGREEPISEGFGNEVYLMSRAASSLSPAQRMLCIALAAVGALICLVLVSGSGSAATITVDDDGPADYSTIQAAIDNATAGDTVQVAAGTYYENVVVDKQVSISGAGAGSTVVDGGDVGLTINVTANQVEISGMSIANGSGPTISDIDCGLGLFKVTGSYIHNATFHSNDGWGSYVYHSNYTIIENCTFTGNQYGAVYYRKSDNGLIQSCDSSLNYYDIHVYFCVSLTLRNNDMDQGNTVSYGGVQLWGETETEYNSHDIDTTNTVAGKPVYYYTGQTGGTVPADAGQVMLASCQDMTVQGLTITGRIDGVKLAYSTGCTVSGNTLNQNMIGLKLSGSDSNIVQNNTVTLNKNGGIGLDQSSDYNVIRYNTVNSNTGQGISIDGAWYNDIYCNTLNSNWWGIYSVASSDGVARYCEIFENDISSSTMNNVKFSGASSNRVFHNNFVGNNCYDTGTNSWDDGYPSGGNYWDHWTSPDDYYGPAQDQAGSDGIVDNPLNISGGINVDNYPLINPNGWPANPSSPPPEGDWNVTENQTHENETFHVNGTLTVTNGVTLTFINCNLTGQKIIVNNGGYLKVRNCTFNIEDIIVHNGGTIDTDPTELYIDGNVWIDGDVLWDDTIVYMNVASHGEFNIQVNATGNLTIRNGSTVRSNTTFKYKLEVLAGGKFRLENSTVTQAGWTTTSPGLVIYADDTYIYNATLQGNFRGITYDGASGGWLGYSNVTGSLNRGISMVNGANNITVTESNVSGSAEDGINVDGSVENTFANTDVYGNGRYGILASTWAHRNTITGCTVRGSSLDGIAIFTVSDENVVSLNTITGNVRHGVQMWNSCDWNEFKDNNISDNGNSGIYMSANNRYNQMDGNTIANNVNSGTGAGIYVTGCQSNTIANNTVTGQQKDGIRVLGGSTNTVIVNNDISGNAGHGLFMDGTSTGSWTVTGTASLTDDEVNVRGGLVVEAAGRLSVSNATLDAWDFTIDGMMIVESSSGTVITHDVWVNGTLYVNGSAWKVNNTADGQYGIQVNASAAMYVLDGSLVTTVDANFEFLLDVLTGAAFRVENSTVADAGWDITNCGVRVYADGAFLYNATLTGNYIGVYFQSSTGHYVIGSAITGSEGYGISLASAPGNTIQGNTITGCAYGMYLSSGANTNVIEGNVITGSTLHGISLGGVSNTIDGNNLSSNGGDGVRVSGSWNVISNNTIKYNTGFGVYISGDTVEWNDVKDNNVSYNGESGIHLYDRCDNTEIINNTVYGNTDHGIWTRRNDVRNVIAWNTVVDNLVTDTTYGNGAINVYDGMYAHVHNNTVLDNAKVGIYTATGTEFGTIENNTVMGGTGGITLSYTETTAVRYNHVENCGNGIAASNSWPAYIYIGFNDIINNTGYGVDLDQTTRITVENNNITGHVDGIRMSGAAYADLHYVANNTITGASEDGIWLEDGQDNRFVDNAIQDCGQVGLNVTGASDLNVAYGNDLANNTMNGRDETANTTWDNGVDTGNTWDDFASNRGWPYVYAITDGTSPKVVDRYPAGAGSLAVVYVSAASGDDDFNGGTWSYPFKTIQKGVDEVQASGTVNVSAGTYNENVVVNRTLNLTGAGREVTTIDGGGVGDVVYVTANRVNVTGFNITNSGSGNWDAGVHLYLAENCSIADVICFDNNIGVRLTAADWTMVTNSTIHSNARDGIRVFESRNNRVEYNDIRYNLAYGIHLFSFDTFEAPKYTLIKYNTVDNNSNGIMMSDESDYTQIHKNDISGNTVGIDMYVSKGNTITNNTIRFGSVGIKIRFGYSINNIVRNNTIQNNAEIGMNITGADNNLIYHNNFLNNTIQANDDGTNTWNLAYPTGGNYWSDWTAPDVNGDKFVDDPYVIPGAGGDQDDWPHTTADGWLKAHPAQSVYNVDQGLWYPTIYYATLNATADQTIQVPAGTYDGGFNIENNVTVQMLGDFTGTNCGISVNNGTLLLADGSTFGVDAPVNGRISFNGSSATIDLPASNVLLAFSGLDGGLHWLTVEQTNATPAGMTDAISRYWNVTTDMAAGTFSVDVTFTYYDEDLPAAQFESSLQPFYGSGGAWYLETGTGVVRDITGNTLTLQGLDHFTNFTLGAGNITMTAVDITPDNAANGVDNVGILRLDFANTDVADTLNVLNVTANNTADADVDSITLWADDGDGVFEPYSDDTRIVWVNGFTGGLVSFTGLSEGVPVGTTYYFISFNISASAEDGNVTDGYIAAGDAILQTSGPSTQDEDPAGNVTINVASGGLYTPFDLIGYVYDGGAAQSGVFVTIENTATGEILTDVTDGSGRYKVQAADYPSGYNDGDEIWVNASTGGQSAWNNGTIDTSGFPFLRIDLDLDGGQPASQASIAPDHNNTGSWLVTYAYDDPVDGQGDNHTIWNATLWLSFEGGAWNAVAWQNGTSVNGTFVWSDVSYGEGNYSFKTNVTDQAGNVEQDTGYDDFIIYDVTQPTSTAAIAATYSNTGTWFIAYAPSDPTAGQEVSGVLNATLYLSFEGGAWDAVAWQNGTSVNGTFVWNDVSYGEGNYSFKTNVTDSAGNQEQDTGYDDFIIYDVTAPTSQASIVTTYNNTGAWTITYAWADPTAGQEVSGVENVTLLLSFEGGAWTEVMWDEGAGIDGIFAFVPALGEGNYSFKTNASDRALNVEVDTGMDDWMIYDTTLPASQASIATEHNNTGSWFVTYAWNDPSLGQEVSGVENVTLLLSYEGGAWTEVMWHEGAAINGTFVWNDVSNGEGNYSFRTLATDRAGNVELDTGMDDWMTYDATLPEWTIEFNIQTDVDGDGRIDTGDTLFFWLNVTDDNLADTLPYISVDVDETVGGAASDDNAVASLVTANGGATWTFTYDVLGDLFTTSNVDVSIADLAWNWNVQADNATFDIGGEIIVDYYAKWNLFALPVLDATYWTGTAHEQFDKAADFESVPNARMVSKWDNANNRYVHYIIGFNLPGDAENFDILVGEGYFVWFDADTSMNFTGNMPRLVTVNVGAGWNVVGWTQTLNGTASADIAPQVMAGLYDDIAEYNRTSGGFNHWLMLGDDEIILNPGRGYFVWSDVTTTVTYGS